MIASLLAVCLAVQLSLPQLFDQALGASRNCETGAASGGVQQQAGAQTAGTGAPVEKRVEPTKGG